MNRFTLMAGTVCALLFAGIVAELVSNVMPTADASQPRNTSVSLASADVAAGNVEDAVRVIEARPVFNRNRQPMTSDAPAARPTLAVSSFNRRLTGVVIQTDKRAAIFSGEGGNNRGIVVPEGSEIEGWYVQSVTPTNVTLVTLGQSQVLELIKNKSKSVTTSSLPPPGPVPPALSLVPPPGAVPSALSLVPPPGTVPSALSLVPSFPNGDLVHFESALAVPPPPSLPPRP